MEIKPKYLVYSAAPRKTATNPSIFSGERSQPMWEAICRRSAQKNSPVLCGWSASACKNWKRWYARCTKCPYQASGREPQEMILALDLENMV